MTPLKAAHMVWALAATRFRHDGSPHHCENQLPRTDIAILKAFIAKIPIAYEATIAVIPVMPTNPGWHLL